MAICEECNHSLLDTDQYCIRCGASQILTSEEMTRRHKKKYFWLKWAAVIVVAVAILVGVYQCLNGNLYTGLVDAGIQLQEIGQQQYTQQQEMGQDSYTQQQELQLQQWMAQTQEQQDLWMQQMNNMMQGW